MRAAGTWRRHYGSEPWQFGDLHLGETRARRRAIVVIHGGFWRPLRTLDMTNPAAADLARRGWVAWNVEYRRNGQGSWPATLDDCSAAVDHLASLGDEFGFDVADPLVVGHSAGGHLAVWSAGRGAVAARTGGPAPIVDARDVVALAAVLDFQRAAQDGTGERAVAEFVGGEPAELPARYRDADPMCRLPTGGRVCCVHSRADERVPFEQSVSYVAAARAGGDEAELIEVGGAHSDVIDVSTVTWRTVVDVIESFEAMGGDD